MNKTKINFIMTSFIKTMRIASMAFAFVLFVAVPQVAGAYTVSSSASLVSSVSNSSLSNSSGSNSNTNTNSSNTSTASSGNITQIACAISVSDTSVDYGSSVTFSWSVGDYGTVTIGGNSVSGSSGSYTVSNITANRIFQIAAFDNNGNPCAAQIIITCNPPVLYCELDVQKTVNKTSAVTGEELTYTITVKNTGNGNCTGSGVKILDVLDPNIEYLRHSLTSNVIAGYDSGTIVYNVYEAASRTLYFNGDVLTPGESGTITWVGKVKTPSQCGDFRVDNQAKATAYELNNFLTWVRSSTVSTNIDYDCPVDPVLPTCDSFVVNPTSIVSGGNSVLTWNTTNATRVTINNGIGDVAADGNTPVSPLVNTTYTLTVFGTNNQTASCTATVTVSNDPVPVCNFFRITPTSVTPGTNVTFSWNVSNATSVVISPTIGSVASVGTAVRSVTQSATYTLVATDSNGDQATCTANVNVTSDPVPVCNSFTASPTALPVGGGNVTFDWSVLNATNVTISPIIGVVGSNGPRTINVTQSATYILTATDSNGDQATCTVPVVVADPSVFTCANNVNFTASDYSITRGNDINLNWTVTGADSVMIDNINATSFTGTQTVSPSSDITYNLKATKGSQTINCPISINVSSGGGGGGGGSATPRCDLSISDKKIERGEEITLKWNTSNATEITITDDRGKVIVTTEDKLSSDKRDLFDDEIDLTPTRDTTYTLLAERGSRDRECTVSVDVDDGQVLGEVRDQQPLVAGIALSQVPYTGFEAGPILTLMFYLLLMAWALYIAYFLVIRQQNQGITSTHFATASNINTVPVGTTHSGSEAMKGAEATRPDVFAAAAVDTPVNLPTADKAVGYENYFGGNTVTESYADTVVTALENRAHTQKALLSSDAIEFFMSSTEGDVERTESIDAVIAKAKTQYPLEDGWIVINKTRMQGLCEECVVANPATISMETLPDGAGSLAEAIVTGNVIAAYEMIGNRPMFALANAASDLDSVVRSRKGGSEVISDLLKIETAKISDEKLQSMISALTGALDGTYTDEASAVKMAIMKAVKEAA